MSIKKSVRLSDLAQSLCQVLSPHGDVNWSGSVNKIAERYDFFVFNCLPELKDCEKNALYEAFNGYIPGDDLGQEIKIFSWRISESIRYNANFVHLLNNGGVDEAEFLNKVKVWTESERLAVIDLCERFWNQGRKVSLLSVDRIKSYRTNLVIYTSDGQTFNLDFDGACGEYSKKQWLEDGDIIPLFDEDGQNKILDSMERQFNVEFFADE